MTKEELIEFIKHPNDRIIFAICKALQKGVTAGEIVNITKIDEFFIRKLKKIIRLAEEIKNSGIAWLVTFKLC
jgi:carbamoyl-phosphate synthase large subunit